MINIVYKELEIEEELKKQIEITCDFCNTKPTFINGRIRNIERTNLSYIEPHRIIIKGITFLSFNYSDTLYVGNLSQKIDIKDLIKYSLIIINIKLRQKRQIDKNYTYLSTIRNNYI